MRKGSIKFRLSLLLCITLTACLLAAGVILYHALLRQMNRHFNAQLSNAAQILTPRIQQNGSHITFITPDMNTLPLTHPPADLKYIIWSRDLTDTYPMHRNPSPFPGPHRPPSPLHEPFDRPGPDLSGESNSKPQDESAPWPPRHFYPLPMHAPRQAMVITQANGSLEYLSFERASELPSNQIIKLKLNNGQEVRAYRLSTAMQFQPPPGAPPTRINYEVLVYASPQMTSGIMNQFLVLLISLGPIMVLLIVVLVLLLVNHELKPLLRLSDRVSELDAEQLSDHFEFKDAPNELNPVIDQLDQLLGRLDHAFRRERAMTGDIAHELRTPIAGIRSTLEVAMADPVDHEDLKEAGEDALKILVGMQSKVDNLLQLSRLEGGHYRVKQEELNPEAIFDEQWGLLEHRALARGLSFQTNQGLDDLILSDHFLLECIAHNLMSNAVSYATKNSTIQLHCAQREHYYSIQLSNASSKLSAEDLPRLKERYWRKDVSRQDVDQHSGIGLTMVHRCAELLNAGLDFDLDAQHRFYVRLHIPRQPDDDA